MLITLSSTSGAPGVSTTALGLTLIWPRDVILIEADPSGTSPTLAGFFNGAISPRFTALDLTTGDEFEEKIINNSLPLINEQKPMRKLIPGVANPLHGQVLSGRWPHLASALLDLERAGIDIIADLGRTNNTNFAKPLHTNADISLLLLTPTITQTLAARSALTYTNLVDENPLEHPSFHLVTIDKPNTYRPSEVTKALGHPTLGSIPYRPEHAAVLSDGAPRPKRYDTSSYVRSIHSLANSIQTAAKNRRTAVNNLRGDQ